MPIELHIHYTHVYSSILGYTSKYVWFKDIKKWKIRYFVDSTRYEKDFSVDWHGKGTLLSGEGIFYNVNIKQGTCTSTDLLKYI